MISARFWSVRARYSADLAFEFRDSLSMIARSRFEFRDSLSMIPPFLDGECGPSPQVAAELPTFRLHEFHVHRQRLVAGCQGFEPFVNCHITTIVYPS